MKVKVVYLCRLCESRFYDGPYDIGNFLEVHLPTVRPIPGAVSNEKWHKCNDLHWGIGDMVGSQEHAEK